MRHLQLDRYTEPHALHTQAAHWLDGCGQPTQPRIDSTAKLHQATWPTCLLSRNEAAQAWGCSSDLGAVRLTSQKTCVHSSICMTIKVKHLPPTIPLSKYGSKRRSGLIVILYCSSPIRRDTRSSGGGFLVTAALMHAVVRADLHVHTQPAESRCSKEPTQSIVRLQCLMFCA
jgi:hypothetical protein